MAFFRTGSSTNVPKAFADMLATSRAAAEYRYVTQVTESSGLLGRQYTRGRGILPIGGYGAARTSPANNVELPTTYAVYPEFSRLVSPTAVPNKTPQQACAVVACAMDFTADIATPWIVGDYVEYDYGRTLRFRSILSNVASLPTSALSLSYLNPTTGLWVALTLTAGMNEGLDFTARKLRVLCNTASSANPFTFFFVPYVEKGTAFAQAAFTHVVLVPLTTALPGISTYLFNQPDDYYGLVLDVGTDITLGVPTTGMYSQMCVPDIRLPIADNFRSHV